MDRWGQLPKSIRLNSLTYNSDRDLESASLAGRSMREDVEDPAHFRMRDTVRHKDDAKDVYTRRLKCENAQLIGFTSHSFDMMPTFWYKIYDFNEDDIKEALSLYLATIRLSEPPIEMGRFENLINSLRQRMRGYYTVRFPRTGFSAEINVIISPIIKDIEKLPHAL